MRYKLIYFYLPLEQSPASGSRIANFNILDIPVITTSKPGYTISDDDRDYYSIDGIPNVYESEQLVLVNNTRTWRRSNWFVKVLEESDPFFNIDMIFSNQYSEDIDLNINIDTVIGDLVPQFLGRSLLNIGRELSRPSYYDK
jgi:hypothetical protein